MILLFLFSTGWVRGDTRKIQASSSTVKKEIVKVKANSDKEIYFVASMKAKKYHRPSCRTIKRILKKNLIKFSCVEDAKKKGYEPCKVCLPPEE